MADFERSIAGRRVFVTGHSGFTGGWLVLWLRQLGCTVSGLALPPNTEPSLFKAARVDEDITSEFGDIRDFAVVKAAMDRADPELVIHLAAQPLVSVAFDDPIETIASNALGTAHVLEASRLARNVKAVVCITTDKVYADEADIRPHREDDRLGGKDPYSASKAAAEIIAMSYAATLAARGNGCRIATARGGNIIGGGDWSRDRIVPDFARAVAASTELTLRRPNAVRPWQHVLALVHGYLMLADHLLRGLESGSAWNFGPGASESVTVEDLVRKLAASWTAPELSLGPIDFPETNVLRVDSTKARSELGWTPPLDIDRTIALTGAWYRAYYDDPESARAVTLGQIEDYRRLL
jgi:CDP-glucose 4,6-dehydratase